MLPRLVIYGRRVVLARAASLDIYTPFAILLHRRNRGLSAISSFRGKRNSFSPGAIRRRNNCSGNVKEEAAKAWSAKSKASIVMWGQSSRHGSLGTSGIPNSFLPRSLATARHREAALWGCSKRDWEHNDVRIFLSKVALGVIKNDLDQHSGLLPTVRVLQQSHLDVLVTDR